MEERFTDDLDAWLTAVQDRYVVERTLKRTPTEITEIVWRRGETAEEALVREILEELRVRVSVESHICDVSWDYPTFHLEMAAYLATIEEGTLELTEHEAARWVDGTDIRAVTWLPADLLVVSALRERGIV